MDRGIGGGIGESPKGYGGHVTFYAGVPDVDETLQGRSELAGRLSAQEQRAIDDESGQMR